MNFTIETLKKFNPENPIGDVIALLDYQAKQEEEEAAAREKAIDNAILKLVGRCFKLKNNSASVAYYEIRSSVVATQVRVTKDKHTSIVAEKTYFNYLWFINKETLELRDNVTEITQKGFNSILDTHNENVEDLMAKFTNTTD